MFGMQSNHILTLIFYFLESKTGYDGCICIWLVDFCVLWIFIGLCCEFYLNNLSINYIKNKIIMYNLGVQRLKHMFVRFNEVLGFRVFILARWPEPLIFHLKICNIRLIVLISPSVHSGPRSCVDWTTKEKVFLSFIHLMAKGVGFAWHMSLFLICKRSHVLVAIKQIYVWVQYLTSKLLWTKLIVDLSVEKKSYASVVPHRTKAYQLLSMDVAYSIVLACFKIVSRIYNSRITNDKSNIFNCHA